MTFDIHADARAPRRMARPDREIEAALMRELAPEVPGEAEFATEWITEVAPPQAEPMLSPLARRPDRLRRGGTRRPGVTVRGVCVHTTGSGPARKAPQRRTTPLRLALDYYLRGGGGFPHYVVDYDGTIHATCDEREVASHAGWAGIGGRTRWARWTAPAWWSRVWGPLGKRTPADLVPAPARSPNDIFIGIEMLADASGWGFRPAQYQALANLIVDIARRHGLRITGAPSPELLGHEDVDPISRSQRAGGWDPGAHRTDPRFSWQTVWQLMHGGSPPPAPAPPPSPSPSRPVPAGVNQATVQRIRRFDALIERIAAAENVNPAIVRGIIAAESGGNPLLEAPSGYKGLMQAERDRGQFDPETSIRTGTRKYRLFRDQYLGPPLARLGIDLRSVDEDTAVRWVMTAYNAGQRTVLKAVEYARAAGDHRQWMAPEHMQRALVHTSAYSVPTALRAPLRALNGEALARELAALTRQPIDALRGQYGRPSGAWDDAALRNAIISHVGRERLELKGKDLPMAEVRRRASRWLIESVEFKHRNQPRYVDRVIAYKRYFQRDPSGRPDPNRRTATTGDDPRADARRVSGGRGRPRGSDRGVDAPASDRARQAAVARAGPAAAPRAGHRRAVAGARASGGRGQPPQGGALRAPSSGFARGAGPER
jgi:hypothetical protein